MVALAVDQTKRSQTNLHAGPARQAQSHQHVLRRQSAAEESRPEEERGELPNLVWGPLWGFGELFKIPLVAQIKLMQNDCHPHSNTEK